jgi:hypothetical protein
MSENYAPDSPEDYILQFGFIRNNSKANTGSPQYANNIGIFDPPLVVTDLNGLHIMKDGPEIYITANLVVGTPATITDPFPPGLTINNEKEISIINDGTAYINGTLTTEKCIFNGFRRLISTTNAYMLIDEKGNINTPVFINGNSTGNTAELTLPKFDHTPNITNAILELVDAATLTITDTLINGGGITTTGTPEISEITMNGTSQIFAKGTFYNGFNYSSLAKLTLNNNATFTASNNVANANINTIYPDEV